MRGAIGAFLALALVVAASAARSDEAEDRAAVLEAVQDLFNAMATADAELATRVLIPDGQLVAVTETEDGVEHRIWSHAEFVEFVGSREAEVVERMWDPTIRIDGAVATLHAGYDFHRDGVFSHCGIDVFTLLRAAEGWRISGGTFTREAGPCPDNPLPEL